jgi:hypothetical protein
MAVTTGVFRSAFDSVDEQDRSVTSGRATAVAHLLDRHGFGFDDLETGIPAAPALDELHADLHAQEIRHGLESHRHRTALVEFASGEVVGVFDNDEAAIAYALLHFGEEAGREYGNRLTWEAKL